MIQSFWRKRPGKKLYFSFIFSLFLHFSVCHIENRANTSAALTTPDVVRHVFDGNFYPNFRFITKVVAHMKMKGTDGGSNEPRGGKIIVLNSYAGMQGISHSSTFCASRFALNGFVQSAAAETLASKIRSVFNFNVFWLMFFDFLC